jgi:hypothetical protein
MSDLHAPPGARIFLARLAALPEGVAIAPRDLALPADDEQHRARLWCRRCGLAFYDRLAGGWSITPRGRAELLKLQQGGGKA